jgi:hypothetical protein
MSPLSPVYREPDRLYLWDGRSKATGATTQFTLRVDEPTVANTGPTLDNSEFLSRSPGLWTISSPGVYENYKFTGYIKVTNPTGVIIRNNHITMPANAPNGIQFEHSNANGNLVEHNTIIVPEINRSDSVSTCIRGRGFTSRRNNYSGAVDGSLVWASVGQPMQDVRFEGDYMHDFPKLVSALQEDGYTHNDGVQGQSNLNEYVIGCAIWGGRTSCLIFTSAYGPWGKVVVEDNWFYGDAVEGATVNAASSTAMTDLTVHRNRIWRGGHAPHLRASVGQRHAASWGMVGADGNTSGWTPGPNCNVFMDDNSPVYVANG